MLFRAVSRQLFPSVAAARRPFVTKTPVPITVAHGDGIGPEIMASTLDVLKVSLLSQS